MTCRMHPSLREMWLAAKSSWTSSTWLAFVTLFMSCPQFPVIKFTLTSFKTFMLSDTANRPDLGTFQDERGRAEGKWHYKLRILLWKRHQWKGKIPSRFVQRRENTEKDYGNNNCNVSTYQISVRSFYSILNTNIEAFLSLFLVDSVVLFYRSNFGGLRDTTKENRPRKARGD